MRQPGIVPPAPARLSALRFSYPYGGYGERRNLGHGVWVFALLKPRGKVAKEEGCGHRPGRSPLRQLCPGPDPFPGRDRFNPLPFPNTQSRCIGGVYLQDLIPQDAVLLADNLYLHVPPGLL